LISFVYALLINRFAPIVDAAATQVLIEDDDDDVHPMDVVRGYAVSRC
jgi:hypothetical protein